MAVTFVTVADHDGVAVLTADRPPANAMDVALLREVVAVVEQVAIGVLQAELAPHAARLLALGNQLVDAQTCLRLGVFDEVCKPEQVLPRALELAGELAEMPADVYASTKEALRGATTTRLRAAAEDDPLLAGWLS